MPPLTQFLLDVYGWRGTMLIMVALNMHITLSGALLIPVHPSASAKSDDRLLPTTTNDTNAPLKSNKEQLKITKTIIRAFDLDLFANIEYLSLMCTTCGNGYHFTGWLIYLVPHAEDLGFSPYTASTLATAGGFGLLMGSFAFPLLAKVLSSKSMIFIFHFIAFVALAIDPLFSIGPFYFGLISDSFVLNFAHTAYVCAFNKESVRIVPESRVHSFFNLTYVPYGIGSILSGFTSGKSISLVKDIKQGFV